MGKPVRGRASWFGGGHDSGNPRHDTASGVSDSFPGLAVRPGGTFESGRPTLGGYWLVNLNGKRKVIRQTDLGPHQDTGRTWDFTPAALKRFGLTTSSFKTDSTVSGVYLGKSLSDARRKAQRLGAYGSRGGGSAPRTAGAGTALPAVPAPSLVSTPETSTGADPADLLRAQGVGTERKAQVTGTSLALPAFAAAAVAPQGGTVEPAAAPAATDPAAAAPAGIGDLLKQLPTVTATSATVSPVVSAQSLIRSQRAALTPPRQQQEQAGQLASALDRVVQRANTIDAKHMPYLWGGGHAGGKVNPRKTGPLDCSGAVSAVLGINTRVSGELASWGRPGRGKHVTIYANPTHTLMEINGHFFGTSGTNKGGGAGWIPRSAISADYLKNFTARHPAGM